VGQPDFFAARVALEHIQFPARHSADFLGHGTSPSS
jgi:hypothetical protein